MDSLSGITAFIQVAETRSFTEAGRLLEMSASAVGKSVARMEERLGVRLFHRSTRSMTLTGDLKITNPSAFGGVGDDYVIEGAHGDNLPLQILPIPDIYQRLPASALTSAVLELAELYAVYAQDLAEGTHVAATFDDAVRMHGLLDAANIGVQSPYSGAINTTNAALQELARR